MPTPWMMSTFSVAVEHRLVDEPVHQGQGFVYPEAHQVEAGQPGRGPMVARGGAAPDGFDLRRRPPASPLPG